MKKNYKRCINYLPLLLLGVSLFYSIGFKESFANDLMLAEYNVLENPTDHRQVPTEFFTKSNKPDTNISFGDKDGNLYFPMPENPEIKYSNLMNRNDKVQIRNGNDLVNPNLIGRLRMVYGEDKYNTTMETCTDKCPYGYYDFISVNPSDGENIPGYNSETNPNILRLTTLKVIGSFYNPRYIINIRKDNEYTIQEGDTIVAHFYAKVHEVYNIAGNESSIVQINTRFDDAADQDRGEDIRNLTTKVIYVSGNKWTDCYVYYHNIEGDYVNASLVLDIIPSFTEAAVDIAGLEVYKFGTGLDVEDMPNGTVPYEGYQDGAPWREAALDRIENIRKGNVNITLKDENGNPIQNKEIDINMYEHEFSFSGAVSFNGDNNTTGLFPNFDSLKMKTRAKLYREKFVENFNSLGTIGCFHRRVADDANSPYYETCKKIVEWAKNNGVDKEIHGHALTPNGEKDSYRSQTYLNMDEIYKKDINGDFVLDENGNKIIDRENFQTEITNHIGYMLEEFKDVTLWDVTGEQASRASFASTQPQHWYFGSLLGKEIIVDWYNYVNQKRSDSSANVNPNARFVFNDTFVPGYGFEKIQKPYMEWAVQNFDFDVVGVQGHFGYDFNPVEMQKVLEWLSDIPVLDRDENGEPILDDKGNVIVNNSYPKKLVIAEFDTNALRDDPYYQGNITRDALILFFSMESVDMVQLWGFVETSGSGSNTVMYYRDDNNNYTLKPGGMVYQDLVYNKWWTRENLTSNEEGKASLRAFYGDYDITVNGKTISIPLHKENFSDVNNEKMINVDLISDSVTGELIAVIETSKNQFEIISTCSENSSMKVGKISNNQIENLKEANKSYVINRLNFLSLEYNKQNDSNLEALLNINNVERNIMLKGVREVSGISIKTNPIKATYIKGENLDLTSGVITVTYNDGLTEDINMTASEVSVTGYDKTKLGSQEITVTYSGKTAKFNVTVTNNVTGISVKTNPTKTTYVKGENLVLTGGVITATYQDTTTNDVSMTASGVSVTGYDKTKLGSQEITVTYSGKTAKFNVEVMADDTLKDILENKGYDVSNNYVSNFTVGDSIITIKNKLGNDVIIETDKEIIATGAVIKKGNESYTVVIKGDLTGDGKVNSGDLLKMRKYLLEEVNLVGAYKKAGIIESNNEIKSLDLLRLRQYLLDEYVFK